MRQRTNPVRASLNALLFFICLLILLSAILCGFTLVRQKNLQPCTFWTDARKVNQVITRLQMGANPDEIASLVGGSPTRQATYGSMTFVIINLPDSLPMDWAIRKLSRHPQVVYAEPNSPINPGMIPVDPWYDRQQYCHKRMQSESAWDVFTGSEDVIVAVIDSGVDGSHPEFAGRLATGFSEMSRLGATPINTYSNNDPMGHGTHVAGIIAATGNNGIGIAGLDWKCKIMPVVAGGNVDTFGYGIMDAVDRGADVINLSWGTGEYVNLMADAVAYARSKGAVLIAGSGNDGNMKPTYPAAYQGVIGVGSTNNRDEISRFSTRGTYISVTAPGDNIFSTIPLTPCRNFRNLTGYAPASGTSMASPQVAGLCALLKGRYPS